MSLKINKISLRKHGFTSISTTDQTEISLGEVSIGDEIVINYKCSDNGQINATLVSEEGFGYQDFITLIGDQVDGRLIWENKILPKKKQN